MKPPPLPPASRGTAPGRGRLRGRRALVAGGGRQTDGGPDPPVGDGHERHEGGATASAALDRLSDEAAYTSGTERFVDRGLRVPRPRRSRRRPTTRSRCTTG